MKRITVNFKGNAGDPQDKLCQEIFRQHGARFVDGANFGVEELQLPRCVTGDLLNNKVEQCAAALRAAGFNVVSIKTRLNTRSKYGY